MGESLKEQLLRAGFEQQKPTRPTRQLRPKAAKQRPAAEIDLAKAYALRHKQEKDQARARKEAEARENALRKRQNQALDALLKDKALNEEGADIPRHFMDGERITRIYVTTEQRCGLAQGTLAIVKLRRRYLLVDGALAGQARQIKADALVDLSQEADGSDIDL